VRLLDSGAIGESLTWNALWALIYQINGACGEGMHTRRLEKRT
jgi:hypothetical protein